ncbi:MAG TPA: 3TM-type holin [Candidatus Acidoferrum sp.]|nr:3TM-type holin [Candidatus Acidoferrum sp.]
MPLDLTTLLGGNVGDLFSKIVGTFKLSPEKAAELEAAKEAHAADLQKMQLDMEARTQEAVTREVEAASATIRAEATNGDKYTSRARPTFLYVCNLILLVNFLAVPLFGIHGGKPVDFPEPLFWLFGSVMLGYVGARSWEKISGAKIAQGGE